MKTLDEARALQDCGRLIRKARKEKGWTQAQLADAIGVKRSVVSKYENGLIDISISKLSTIEDALCIKFNEQESTLNTMREVETITRCKDCKRWGAGYPCETDKIKCCQVAGYLIGENGYCFYAEAKDRG